MLVTLLVIAPGRTALADQSEMLEVIVVGMPAGNGQGKAKGRATKAVADHDGILLKDLDIIDGVGALVPEDELDNLEADDRVKHVFPNAPVQIGSGGSDTVRDEFNSTSYGNNDRSENWSTDWIESGDNGSPSSGDITVEVDDCPDDDSRCIEFDGDAGLNAAVEREVDLSAASSATLSFDFHLDGSSAEYVLEVSTDGGASWQSPALRTFASKESGSERIDLSAHTSANTRIRFRLTDI